MSGNNASRIFHISGGPTVNISGMKLMNGLSAAPNEGRGGAVYVTGSSVNITNVDISSNVARRSGQFTSGYGGAVYVSSGVVSVTSSVISSNTAVVTDTGAGGGIYGLFSQIHVANSTVSHNQPQGIQADGQSGSPATVSVANSSITNNTGKGVSNSAGSTTLNGSIVRNNGAGVGGGDSASTLNIDSSLISENQPGGGVDNFGTAIISNTSIRNNVVIGTGARGGGIFNFGTMYILNSSVTGNRSFQYGGGIFASAFHHTYLTNSTVSGNIADNGSGNCNCAGGGIYVIGTGDGFVLTNSTVAQNRSAGLGGGIYSTDPATVSLRNSIVAENTSPTSSVDVAASVSSQGFNLIGNTNGSSGWIATDLLNQNPLLAPLANNGGLTFTHAILPSSPAISAGNNDLARNPYDNSLLQFDQRGKGFLRVVNAMVDIGAYEANYAPGPVTLSGRVLTSPNGRGIPRAYITITDILGNITYTQTNPFGYYRFLNLLPGTTYTIRVSNKSFIFDSPQVVTIDQPRDNFDFVALGR